MVQKKTSLGLFVQRFSVGSAGETKESTKSTSAQSSKSSLHSPENDKLSVKSVSNPELHAGETHQTQQHEAQQSAFPRMVTPAQLKIGLQQVLDDQLEEPLSAESMFLYDHA
jgi:hypothetical protein